MKLTPEAREKLSNDTAKMRLALATGKSYATINRYLVSDNDNLTKKAYIKALCDITQLAEEELFEEEVHEQ